MLWIQTKAYQRVYTDKTSMSKLLDFHQPQFLELNYCIFYLFYFCKIKIIFTSKISANPHFHQDVRTAYLQS